MEFSEALKFLKVGVKICRDKWKPTKIQFIYLNNNIIYEMVYVGDKLSSTPYPPTQEDLLADDWNFY